MKWSFNHKSRKAFLTAAICLALSQSVFAMPTGGKIVQGDITGITDGTIASGGTINVNGSGLIDWNAFNIANGESLTYAFSNPGTLINHVTGEEMSKILGTLSSTGNGNLWLINPNGILIGPNAQINTSSLVLSTLNATNGMLQDFLNGKDLILTGKDATKGIEIQSGVKIDVENALNILGGHIQIADNVTVSSAKADSMTMSIAAANQATFEAGSSTDGATDISTGSGNTLSLGEATFEITNPSPDVYFIGHDVSVDGTKINLISTTDKNSTALDIIAANHLSYQEIGNDDENGVLNIDGSNTLSVNGADLTANYMGLVGGKTSIDSSKLTLSKTTDEVKEGTVMPYMRVAALNGKWVIFDDVKGAVQNAENTDAARLSIKDSTLTSNENIALWGGSVELVNSNLKTATETNDKDNNIDIYAFESVDNDGGALTNSSNTVKVTGGSIESGADISMRGAKIALDGVDKVAGTGKKSAVELLAGKTIQTEAPDTIEINGTENNTIDISNTNITSNDGTLAYGGAINIASSSMKDNNYSIQIAAANYYLDDGMLYTDGKDSGEPRFLASTNNSVTLDNAQLTTSAKGYDGVNSIGVMSGNVTVKNKSTLDSGDIWLTAGKSYEDKNTTEVLSADSDMNLTVSDSTLKASEDATLVGAAVNLTNTSLTVGTEGQDTTGTNGIVRLAAGQDVTLYDQDGRGFGIESVDKTGNLTMNKVTLSAQGDVMAYGKTVKLQDSNLSTTNDQDLTINALNTYKRVDGTSDTWTATKDNTMDVTGTTLTNKGIIELSSGKLTMDKSNLTATGKEGAILVDARASYTDDDNGAYVNKAVNGMDVSIKDSNFSGDNGVLVVGNTVTIDGQSAAKSTNAKVFFATGTESEMTDTSIKGNGAPVNVGKDVKYDAKNTEFAPSMKTIETKPDQPSDPGTKPSDPGTQPSDPGTKPSDPGTKPTEPDQPSKPDKPIVTPDPKPAVDVEKNIEQGKQDMTKALADNQDNASAAVKQQAEKLSSSKMTDEEKAAQVKGYAEAIENSQASAEEKQALVKDTVKSFEPTQQSSIEAQNKQDEAAQNNNAQTVIPDVTVKTVAPAEHEGAAATVTVDGTVVNE